MLHRLFALNGEPNVIVLFVVHKSFEIVSFRKAFHHTFTVFEGAANKIIGDAQIENTIWSIAKNVDLPAFDHGSLKQGVDGRDKPGHDVEMSCT
jgi:hypothetical protein